MTTDADIERLLDHGVLVEEVGCSAGWTQQAVCSCGWEKRRNNDERPVGELWDAWWREHIFPEVQRLQQQARDEQRDNDIRALNETIKALGERYAFDASQFEYPCVAWSKLVAFVRNEMREPMACGHAKANTVQVHEQLSKTTAEHKLGCSICRELAQARREQMEEDAALVEGWNPQWMVTPRSRTESATASRRRTMANPSFQGGHARYVNELDWIARKCEEALLP